MGSMNPTTQFAGRHNRHKGDYENHGCNTHFFRCHLFSPFYYCLFKSYSEAAQELEVFHVWDINKDLFEE